MACGVSFMGLFAARGVGGTELRGVWYALEGGYLCCWPCRWGMFFGRSGFIWWERGGLRRSFEEGAGEVEIRPSALGLSPFLGASFEGVFGARNCATKKKAA